MNYRKLGHVADDVTAGDLTIAQVLLGVESGDLRVVNVKGLVLTSAQVSDHLTGAVDGDTLTWTPANVWPE